MIQLSIVLISLGFSGAIILMTKDLVKPKSRYYWGIVPFFVTPIITLLVMIASIDGA